jgi:hypothetical protein
LKVQKERKMLYTEGTETEKVETEKTQFGNRKKARGGAGEMGWEKAEGAIRG